MNIKKITNIVNGDLIKSTKKKIKKIRINSQEVKSGDVFIAITGKNKDGHDYIKEAIKKKASTIILSKRDESIEKENINIILVTSTIEALKLLAQENLNTYQTPVIAITGSLGKTTTKNLIYNILGEKYNVLKSKKSYNNIIGVSLTLLEIEKEHEIVILEMGMNNTGEISELSKLCNPFVSVITNISASHIGNLGSLKNILKAKMEIIEGMEDGILVVNGLDKRLKKIKCKNVDVIKTGINNIKCDNADLYFDMTILTLIINDKLHYLKYYIPGKYIIPNILLAIEIGLLFDVEINQIFDMLENYKSVDSRLDYTELNKNNTLLDDSYNASYKSIMNLLSVLKLIDKEIIFILGEIHELGDYSSKIHKKIVKKVNKNKNINLITVGKVYEKYNLNNFSDINELLDSDILDNIENKFIVLKGSRKSQIDIIGDKLKLVYKNSNHS